MQVPMYIRHLIYKRRDNARRFLKNSNELSAWLAGNGISVEGVRLCHPYAKEIERVIGEITAGAALEAEAQHIIEAIKAAADPKAELTD